MKRKALSLFLALALCAGLCVPALADTVEKIDIQIPGSSAIITVEGAEDYYVITDNYAGIPVYRFSLPGTEGRVSGDTTALLTFGTTWEDAVNPSDSWFGGGDQIFDAGWSEGCPEYLSNENGKGQHTVEFAVFADGSLDNYQAGTDPLAYAVFYFGGPLTGDPDDMISYVWQSTSVPGAGAGGPDQKVAADLAKLPLTGLAVAAGEEPQPPAEEAPDVPSDWAYADVGEAIGKGLVFPPLQEKYTQAITRAEFCALGGALFFAFHPDAGGFPEGVFTDTDDPYVEMMADLGVVNGIGNDMFGPNDPLTREQAATMLARLSAAVGHELPIGTLSFADNSAISIWALEAVSQMQTAGIMGGVGNNTFDPAGAYTREQSIVTILRLFNLITAEG